MNCQRKQGVWVVCLVAGFFRVSVTSTLQAQTASKDEASCRTFVQRFYDWYINPYVSHGHGPAWYDVARLKPQILSSELGGLLRKEDKKQQTCGCIDHLDFDPFLNSQDPDRKYVVLGVAVANGMCHVTVKGASEVRPELMRTNAGWVFANFHYSFYSGDGKKKLFPDDDLINMLNK
jgi:hypothetical protein